jgi:hypothetical protein
MTYQLTVDEETARRRATEEFAGRPGSERSACKLLQSSSRSVFGTY